MIPLFEFKAKARELGVPVSTIERDYAQNWILTHLGTKNMVLKGGTAIRKVYVENYRFSDDLDFTLTEPTSIGEIKDQIEKSIKIAKEESGIDFLLDIEIGCCNIGFTAKLYFNISRRGGLPLKIKLDITLPENEILLLPPEEKNIIHLFSDMCNAKVLAYSLDEIVAEKIRTLFQRTRPRDLYDIWFFLVKHKRDISKIFVDKKCKFKNVVVNLHELEIRKDHFVKSWQNSLIHQIKDLPDPTCVSEEVLYALHKYETCTKFNAY
ncbi:MAG: nucleotidyl transferase AbiEii/AbiGii toxin family protein [Candidatus Cloacimonetes bacterium]|nr:nucleotidyl transferase AbiEii/AbiGii toxin family protein [Candidatus Cloacimonadota bacterium]MBL7085911.1 nucleotidyl transferase AbiEii/AbiGii toxin family protein [Candidatus Cloacimonadota bacterium]